MALSDVQGTVIAQTVLASLNEASIAQALIGSEIDGSQLVGRGKTLRVAKAGSVTVVDYDGVTPLSPDAINPGYVDLTLDQAKATAISLDDVDAATASVELLAPHAVEAGRALAGEIDADIIAALVDGADNDLGAVTLDGTYTAYNLLLDLAVELDTDNVPAAGRWVIAPPALCAALVLDPRLNRGTAAGDAVAVTGLVGEAAGFMVVKSNRIASGTIVAGHSVAAAFAQAVSRSEAIRSTDLFVSILRNLAVYGVAVIRPEALATATFSVGS